VPNETTILTPVKLGDTVAYIGTSTALREELHGIEITLERVTERKLPVGKVVDIALARWPFGVDFDGSIDYYCGGQLILVNN